MATKKIYDLVVKNGEYTNSQGETKGRYINVGSILQKDDGGKFILLNRHINLAGFPNPDDRDTVIVSMYARNQDDTGEPEIPPSGNYPDDEIPF